MLQLKDLRGRALGEKILEELEETTWRASMFCRAPSFGKATAGRRESRRLNTGIITYWYRTSMIICKWFGCCGIAGRLSRWHRENGRAHPSLGRGAAPRRPMEAPEGRANYTAS